MKTIFITGTTRGIGRETALLFARNGWRVFGCGRDEQKIAEVNEIAKKENLALEVFRMDVTKQEEIEKGVARIMDATDGVGPDVLVNNAGYQELGPVEDLTLETWYSQFDTNFIAYLSMIKAFVPKMRERKSGRIINLASVAGRVSFPIYGAYNASKHAVEGMSDALRMELKQFGIKVVIIEPGPIISNINVTGYANLTKNRPAQTAYGKLYDEGPEKLARLEKNSYPTEMAAKKIYRAATASRPRQRYAVTFVASAAIFAKKFLPGWMMDAILSRSI
ncbi:MAG: SDR family oxidoreductase [Patescibacteria group bacterium]